MLEVTQLVRGEARGTADSEGRAAACSAGFMKALLALHASQSCIPKGSSFREMAENENLSQPIQGNVQMRLLGVPFALYVALCWGNLPTGGSWGCSVRLHDSPPS